MNIDWTGELRTKLSQEVKVSLVLRKIIPLNLHFPTLNVEVVYDRSYQFDCNPEEGINGVVLFLVS